MLYKNLMFKCFIWAVSAAALAKIFGYNEFAIIAYISIFNFAYELIYQALSRRTRARLIAIEEESLYDIYGGD